MGKIKGYFIMPHPPIIINEIGNGEDKKAINTIDSCKKISEEIKKLSPDTIILITPHGNLFKDSITLIDEPYILGDLSRFNAPEIKFKYEINTPLTSSIINYAEGLNISTLSINKSNSYLYDVNLELDHGALVPLYFVNKQYTNYNLVHITYGLLSSTELYKFGMCIKIAIENSNLNTVIIASGDLSHKLSSKAPYGFSPYGKVFDENLLNFLKAGDIPSIFNMSKDTIEAAGECGLRSFYILLGSMDELNIKGNLLSYESPFGIGYGVMKFEVLSSRESLLNKLISSNKKNILNIRENEDAYVKLAREALENYTINKSIIKMPYYVTSEMLKEKRAVFVSLKKDGELRGCIGSIFPAKNNVAEEIIENAIQAGQNDTRFPPVQSNELDELVYSVDILTPPKKTIIRDLNPKIYGIIVRNKIKSGLLLPDLIGIDTVEDQLNIALNKAGISFNEDYTIEKFEVIRHK